jgi:hypothetical protein
MTTVSKLIVISTFLAFGMGGASAQTSSTTDGPVQQKGDQKQDPKTTGAMDKAVGNLATSPEDVKRQTEGQPTAAEQGKGATSTAPKPGMTENSPGTVGAAPGTTPPMGQKTQ